MKKASRIFNPFNFVLHENYYDNHLYILFYFSYLTLKDHLFTTEILYIYPICSLKILCLVYIYHFGVVNIQCENDKMVSICVNYYHFSIKRSTTYATPSSSLERVMKSALSRTMGWAFCMATPRPANLIMERSLNPSPQAMTSSRRIPVFSNRTARDCALSIPLGTSSRK